MPSNSSYKYFAVSERDKRWGLHIANCGESLVAENQEYPPKNHPAHHYFCWQRGRILQEYQMFYLLQGEGVLESASAGKHQLRSGDLVLLFPEDWHRYKPASGSSWHTHWIGFDGIFARYLEENRFFKRTEPVLRIGHQDQVVWSFTRVQALGKDEHAGYQQRMAGLVMSILAEASASQRLQKFRYSNHEEVVRRARILLIESLDQIVTMEGIAQELGLGYSLFRRLFRQYTGLAPGQYLIQLRIERAKELLSDSDRSIKQIACETGFESVSYFSRLFKEKTGQTPAQYRQRALGHTGNGRR